VEQEETPAPIASQLPSLRRRPSVKRENLMFLGTEQLFDPSSPAFQFNLQVAPVLYIPLEVRQPGDPMIYGLCSQERRTVGSVVSTNRRNSSL